MAESKSTTTKKKNHGKIFASWKTKEYAQEDKPFSWLVTLVFCSVALLVYAIWTLNFLFAVIIILTAFIIYMHERRTPMDVAIKITEDGIELGDRFYPYKVFKKFYIIYEPPEIKNLYLETNQTLKPEISIHLEDTSPLRVRDVLLRYLKEDLEKEEESTSDYLSRTLKF